MRQPTMRTVSSRVTLAVFVRPTVIVMISLFLVATQRHSFAESFTPMLPRSPSASIERSVSASSDHALQFGPGITYLTVPQVPAINIGQSLTIEFWLKTAATYGGTRWHDGQWILDKDSDSEVKHDWAVVLRYGQIVFDNGNPTGSADQPLLGNRLVNDGIWHFIGVVRDSSTGRTTIYVDGVKDAEGYFATSDLSNTEPLWIGMENNTIHVPPGNRAYVGYLDELRLWRVARSEDQVRSDGSSPPQGGETDLAAYWSFNEGYGQVAHDVAPGSNSAQLGSSTGPDTADPVWVPVCGRTTADWSAQYYANRTLTGNPATVRCDQNIDFYWGDGDPLSGLTAGNYSVRWTRDLYLPGGMCYRFRTFVGGQLSEARS